MYACLTCTPDARDDPAKRAGVCLACSYNCHEGHEMVELYTKRNFRCDCGTSKILAVKCQLDPLKLDPNTDNLYNQNFSGVYCSCHRPYPDPEDPIDDEMIQCVICEDWYHCRHLITKVPNMNAFSEMICGECMDKYNFLDSYLGLSVQAEQSVDNSMQDESLNVTGGVDDEDKKKKPIEQKKKSDAEAIEPEQVDDDDDDDDKKDESVEEEQVADEQLTDELNQCINDIIEINKTIGESSADDDDTIDEQPPAKRQKTSDNSSSAASSSAANCKKPMVRKIKRAAGSATFWPHDWRLNICNCSNCLPILKRNKLEYLLDQDDTVLCYQEKGMAKATETDYDRGMKALSKMQHGQQIDVLMSYNKLKEKLSEFLNAFVISQQVVTEDDINRFFRMMKEKPGNASNNENEF